MYRCLCDCLSCILLLLLRLFRRLSLERNDLQTLPLSFHELKNLTSLNLSNNQLQGLLGNFCDLVALRQLWMHSNELAKLPAEFGNLTNLVLLNVHNNRLHKLPKSICCLKKLQRLDVSANKLKGLPVAFSNLSALRVCNLSRNALRELPEHFGVLPALQALFLQSNCLMTLPASFVELQTLENLTLNGNKIDIFPQEALRKLRNLRSLTFTENRLKHWSQDSSGDASAREQPEDSSSLSNGLFGLQSVEFLDFSDNVLKIVPFYGWQHLGALLELKLSYNKLSQLPPGIGELHKLQQLDLSYNELTSVPPQLVKLSQLVKLDLQSNALEELPVDMEECISLERLYIAKNSSLEALPDSMCKIPSMKVLQMDKKCFLGLEGELMAFCERLETFITE